MNVKNWMVCQFLMIISTPLQGKITQPVCKDGLANIVFEVEDFYFWRVCNYGSQEAVKNFCSNAGGWLHEPKTKTIVDYMKTSVNLEEKPSYKQGLEKIGDTWTWLQGGAWDNQTPPRKDPDNGANTCSVHMNLVWQQEVCGPLENRYICQFQSCRVDEDCNQNEDCVSSEYNNTMKFCTCKEAYSGTRCGGYCDSNDNHCLNGGTCKDITDSPFYECECVGGFYGQICANNYCDENGIPCQNGGTCQADTTNADYKCMCEPGYYGATCENDYCEFHPETCKNGGSCTSALGSTDYNCDCPPEYNGKNCENELFYKDGDCMYYINKNEVYEYDDAKEQCLTYGGALSMVKTNRIQSFLQSKFVDMYGDTGFDAWIGGEKEDSWKWLDDEIIGYNGYDNWDTDEPSDNSESVSLKRNKDEWKWYGVAKSLQNVGIICEKPDVENWPCLPNNDPCQNGKCTAIGCQAICICSAGYFQRYCDGDLIIIQSDEQRIGVENENLTLSLEITTFDGPLTIIVMKDGSEVSTLVDVDNGTVNYLIVSVQKSDNGSAYTFIASPQSGLYNRSASTEVIVQDTYCETKDDPCQHNGTCVWSTAYPHYTCICLQGYYGNNCTDYCDEYGNLCKNGGTCRSVLGAETFTCDCPPQYTGQDCSKFKWMAAYVAVPLILFGVAAAVFIYCRRKSLKDLKANSDARSMSIYEGIGDEPVYEKYEEHKHTTAIPLHMLKKYYISMKSEGRILGFQIQFKELQERSRSIAPVSKECSKDEVMNKNRDINIVPYETNRVCLKGQGSDSYINASYIKGSDKVIIATQGPMKNTIIDFWRMVVEQACTVIVMLTKCEENGTKQCERYWPALNCEVSYGAYGIANVGEKMSDGIAKTELKVKANGQEVISVIHYLYQRWPEHGIPQTTSSFLRLHKHVNGQLNNTRKRTVVVHCSSGAGRTGIFIGFDLLSDKSKTSVDIYDCVLEMDKQRVNMIQTVEQYEMLHKLLVEHYHFGETDMDRSKLFQKYGSEVMKEFDLLKDFEASNFILQEHCQGQEIMSLGEPTDEGWATIDVTAVEAYQGNLCLIASRGPSVLTVQKFLIALWDNHVEEVIMLSNPPLEAKSEKVNFCEYWPKQLNTILTCNSISITLQREQKIRNTVERTFLLHRRNRQDRIVKQSQYLGWRIGDMPGQEDQIINIMKRIIAFDQESTATILVHCTDGLKRSGIFIAVLNILARLQSENRIDVFRTVKDLRDIRPGMIPTQSDYMCCYDLAKNFLSKQNEYGIEAVMPIGQKDLITEDLYQII